MIWAILALGVALIMSLVLHYLEWLRHSDVERDLLNRLMARDYGEYQALTKADRPPVRRRPMTDAEEAAMVRDRKADKTLQEAARGV